MLGLRSILPCSFTSWISFFGFYGTRQFWCSFIIYVLLLIFVFLFFLLKEGNYFIHRFNILLNILLGFRDLMAQNNNWKKTSLGLSCSSSFYNNCHQTPSLVSVAFNIMYMLETLGMDLNSEIKVIYLNPYLLSLHWNLIMKISNTKFTFIHISSRKIFYLLQTEKKLRWLFIKKNQFLKLN